MNSKGLEMKRLLPVFVIVWMVSLCGITSAQDRSWASSIAWSPDGQTIAVGGDLGVWFFDSDFNELDYVEIEQDDAGWARYVAWNAAGDLVAAASHIGLIRIVDVRKLEVINEIKLPFLWTTVLWHPEDNLVIGGTFDGATYIVDALTGEELFFFDTRAVSPDLEWYETMGFCWLTENTVVIVNHQMIYVVDIVESSIAQPFDARYTISWASCNRDYQIIGINGALYDLQAGSRTFISDVNIWDENVNTVAVAWSPKSGHFVANSTTCLVRVFDGQSGELVAEMPGGVRIHGRGLSHFLASIAWHPDGSRFAVLGQFGDIRVWDAETYELLQRFDGFELHPDTLEYWNRRRPGQLSEAKCP